MNTVICPHCKEPVEISEALRHQFNEQELKEIKAQHIKDIEEARKAGALFSSQKVKEEFEVELKRAKEDAEDKDSRIKKLIEQITELTQDLRNSKKERDEVKLEMQKQLVVEEEKIRIDEQKKAQEEQHLILLAKDKQLQDTFKELEDAKRKLQQGSQQAQGEVFELEFEAILQKEFPNDKIIPVGKGQKGGDIIQEVWDSRGNYNGKILWELKNTKPPWKEEWAVKLKTDLRTISADEGVLISEVLPKEIETAGYRDGVWVTKKTFVIGLACALRAKLIQIYYVKASSKNKDQKVEILHSYLSGIEFKHRMEAIIDAFSNMQNDIEKEKRYFSSKWSRDEKNIRLVIDNTYGMHGDLKSILGNGLPTIKGLELSDGLSNEETE